MIRVKNGPGLLLLVIIAILLALKLMEFPAAGSEQPEPQWEWDSEGKVHDATGQYRTLTDEEVCEQLGWGCERLRKKRSMGAPGSSSDGGGGPK